MTKESVSTSAPRRSGLTRSFVGVVSVVSSWSQQKEQKGSRDALGCLSFQVRGEEGFWASGKLWQRGRGKGKTPTRKGSLQPVTRQNGGKCRVTATQMLTVP